MDAMLYDSAVLIPLTAMSAFDVLKIRKEKTVHLQLHAACYPPTHSLYSVTKGTSGALWMPKGHEAHL